MKKLLLIGAAALISVPAMAIQQAPIRNAAQPLSRAAVQTQVQTHFSAVDTNRDGFVTKAEVEARGDMRRSQRQAKNADRRGSRFERLDTNKDGSVSRAEFDAAQATRAQRGEAGAERRAARAARGKMAGGGLMGGRFGARMLERADADRDGRLSLAEASTAALARFDRVDADRNGMITAAERQAARQRMQQMRSQRQAQPKG